jgi:hypothetical protein
MIFKLTGRCEHKYNVVLYKGTVKAETIYTIFLQQQISGNVKPEHGTFIRFIFKL